MSRLLSMDTMPKIGMLCKAGTDNNFMFKIWTAGYIAVFVLFINLFDVNAGVAWRSGTASSMKSTGILCLALRYGNIYIIHQICSKLLINVKKLTISVKR